MLVELRVLAGLNTMHSQKAGMDGVQSIVAQLQLKAVSEEGLLFGRYSADLCFCRSDSPGA